jgi:hypothetical protein
VGLAEKRKDKQGFKRISGLKTWSSVSPETNDNA